MKRILLSLLFFLFYIRSIAEAEIQIIQVKRNIPLSDEEPIYKDYYLSGGSKNGLRMNLVVPVNRWVNLRENNQSQDQALKILEPVAWLKIIYVQDQLAVARLYEPSNYKNDPILEQPGVMIGDIVSLDNSFLPKPNKTLPKDSLQVMENKTISAASTSTASSLSATTATLTTGVSTAVSPTTSTTLPQEVAPSPNSVSNSSSSSSPNLNSASSTTATPVPAPISAPGSAPVTAPVSAPVSPPISAPLEKAASPSAELEKAI